MSLVKIVSGGQTGVDRGALDAALAVGFACGGWCPKDRNAEDGPIIRQFMPHPSLRSGPPLRAFASASRCRARAVPADGVAG